MEEDMGYNPENLEKGGKAETKPKETNSKTAKDLGRIAVGGTKKK
jgi:hypothetical protein